MQIKCHHLILEYKTYGASFLAVKLVHWSINRLEPQVAAPVCRVANAPYQTPAWFEVLYSRVRTCCLANVLRRCKKCIFLCWRILLLNIFFCCCKNLRGFLWSEVLLKGKGGVSKIISVCASVCLCVRVSAPQCLNKGLEWDKKGTVCI